MPLPWFPMLAEEGQREDASWELFHENSKLVRTVRSVGGEKVNGRDNNERFEGLPSFRLPPAQEGRHAGRIGAAAIAALTAPVRSLADGSMELYFHATSIEGMPPGLHHYDAAAHATHLVRRGDLTQEIGSAMVEPKALVGSPGQIFLTGSLAAAAGRFGERGYRLVLIEAGAMARDLASAATALGLASEMTTGFYDRELDRLLALDGLSAGVLAIIILRAGG